MQNYKFVSNYGYLSVNYYSRPKLQCMKQIGEDRNPENEWSSWKYSSDNQINDN
jgi:hypothetical protein